MTSDALTDASTIGNNYIFFITSIIEVLVFWGNHSDCEQR